MEVRIKKVVEKLSMPYKTSGGMQLCINVSNLIKELKKEGIVLNIDFSSKISEFENIYIKKSSKNNTFKNNISQNEENCNILKCRKCGIKLKRLLFKKINLCNSCYTE